MSQQGLVYREQGGDKLTVASGGEINVESGGALNLGGIALSNVAIRASVTTVSAGQATANAAVIATGFTTVTSAIVQVLRSGVDVTADAIITFSGGNVSVADGGATYNTTAGDKITVLAFGV